MTEPPTPPSRSTGKRKKTAWRPSPSPPVIRPAGSSSGIDLEEKQRVAAGFGSQHRQQRMEHLWSRAVAIGGKSDAFENASTTAVA
jgi:hypothetical protein